MARRRYQPDYSHLRDRPTPWVLDQALAYPPVMQMDRHLQANANEELIKLFDARDLIVYSELLDVFRARGLWGKGKSPGQDWSTNYAAERAGGLIGLGLKLGAVEEDRTDRGERCWRIVCREPVHEWMGDRFVKVRCLTPEQQRELNGVLEKARKKAAATTKLRATLAHKHAVTLRDELVRHLLELSRAEVDTPAEWAEFVPADVMSRWPNLGIAAGMLFDVHMDWAKERQLRWKEAVRRLWWERVEVPRMAPELEAARERSRRRWAEMCGQSVEPEPAPIPDDDMAALGDLA